MLTLQPLDHSFNKNYDLFETLLEVMAGCKPDDAEAYAKACWLGSEGAAMAAAAVAELDPIGAKHCFDIIQSARAHATPCLMTGQQLEDEISWRPFDSQMINNLSPRSEGYAMRFQIVLLGRCSYTEAEVVSSHLIQASLGHSSDLELIDAKTALADIEAGANFDYLLRRGRQFWSSDLRRPDEIYVPGADYTCLDNIHQIWRIRTTP